MAFVVCHMTKYTSSNLGGLQRHNQRETENHTNKDIKTELSYLNYDLINAEKISYPEKIKERIAAGVETNRAIRKDAVRVAGFIVSASPELFKDKPENETRSYFEKATEFFKNRYGADNVVYAQVHMDETTPHMHLGVVPITEDHKLSAKRIFNRKELQNLQKDLPVYMQKQGFSVQKGQSKNKHLDELDYKTQMAEERAKSAQSQAAEAEKTLTEKQKSLAETKKTVDSLIATGGQKAEEAKKATKVLAQRAAQEIQLKAHHMELTQSARTLSGKIEESTETLGELQALIEREKRNLESVKAAADQTHLTSSQIDRIPVEIKRTGILRNGPETVTVDKRDWDGVKTQAKSSLAFREQSERSERKSRELKQRNTRLENRLTESNRENRRLKGLLEKKDALISHFQQAAKELFRNGESVFHQLVGYVKGRFMTDQKVLPEEQKAYEQGAARTKKEFDELEKQFEQEQANKRQKGWEMER